MKTGTRKYHLHISILFVWLMQILPATSFSQDCTILSKANDITPDGLCAPVNLTWEVTYSGVNDGGTQVEFQYDWDDGNPIEEVNATETSPGVWTYTISHTYPQDGPQCNYNPNVTLVVDGVLCSSTVQEQNVTVWDTDDANGGQLEINPDVFPICVGNDGTVTFTDNSLWNCVPPVETDVPNGYGRWTQWVYGTAYTINNVEVDGAVQAYPFSGTIDFYPAVVYAPFPPNNTSLPCFSPNTALVGQFFEVTLRNWNYCNPYDDPNIPGPPADLVNGDNPPIETTAIILIVDIPDATITPAGPFCANASSVNLNAATGGGTWSGNGITNASNGTFNPTVAGVGTHTITYNVTDGNGCVGTDTEDIIVYPNPIVNIQTDLPPNICPGLVINLDGNPSSGTTPYTHIWTGNTWPLNSTIIQDPFFTTVIEGNYNMSYLVIDANGCTATENITVAVAQVSAQPFPMDICEGQDQILNGNPTGGSENYVTHLWTGDITYLSSTNIQLPVFSGTATAGSYSLTYTVTDDNGCIGGNTILVTVYENPLADAGVDDSVCGPVYNLNAIPGLGTGSWNMITGPGSVSYSNQNFWISNANVDTYGVYEFEWTEIYGPGCSDKDTVLIIYTEQPIADAGPNDAICGLDYTLNANPSVGNGYWTFVAGSGTAIFTDSTSSSTDISASNYGIYQFAWTEDNGSGCIDSDDVVITFNTQPTPSFSPDTSGCSPLTITFSNQSVGGINYEWTFDNGDNSSIESPTTTFTNTSSSDIIYNVQLIVSNGGCSDSITKQITVYPLPDAGFISDAQPGCGPMLVNFTNLSSGGAEHIWNYGDSTLLDTSFNTTHVFENDTTYIQYFEVNMVAVTTQGCRDTASGFVVVYPVPVTNITAMPDSACHPAIVNFSAPPWSSSYEWTFGDGTFDSFSGANVVHSYSNPGTSDTIYPVQLVAKSPLGCSDTANWNIVIHPRPVADFTAIKFMGCTPFNINFTNNSTGAINYYWDFGNGDFDTTYVSDTISVYTYLNTISVPITYDLQLVSESEYGCRDSTEHTFSIFPEVHAGLSADTAGCTPLSLQFTNLSSGAIAYAWDFGDGGIASSINPIHTFMNEGVNDTSFAISLTAISNFGCTDSAFHSVDVYPKPEALFNVPTDNGCSSFSFEVTNLSSGADFYIWSFGDGDSTNVSDSVLTHQYNNNQSTPDYFELDLIVGNLKGCYDSLAQTITVFPNIEAAYTVDSAGCEPLSVSFLNQSFGASFYAWDFGDGNNSSAFHPDHTYINDSDSDTTYSSFLIATSIYGCIDTAINTTTIFPKPEASINLSDNAGCSPFNLNIENLSTGTDIFSWSFGDGNFSNTSDTLINYTYSNNQSTPGYHDILLIVENLQGCKDSITASVAVYPDIEAGFTCDTSGCHPFTANFLNQSSGAASYSWDFGDNQSSSAVHPEHVFENLSIYNDTSYTVTLISTSNFMCSDSAEVNIHVYPTPIAAFQISETEGCSPFTADIENLSLGAVNNYWNFGDGISDTTSDISILHDYVNLLSVPNTYPIILNVENNYNCISQSNQQVKVFPEVTANFTSDTAGCSIYSVVFSNQSYGAISYIWDFGDGQISQSSDPEHSFENQSVTDTTFNIKMIATSQYFCTDSSFTTITVYPSPSAEFSVTPYSQMYPDTIVLIENLTNQGNWSYLWNFGNGSTSFVKDPIQHSYSSWGTFEIILDVSSTNCSDTAIKTIEIIPPPPTAENGSSEQGCAPLTVNFTNTSEYATNYYWEFEPGFTSTDAEPIHTFYDPGIYSVSMKSIGPGGEASASEILIEVWEVPTVHFTVGPKLVYLPDQPIHCYNQSEYNSSHEVIWTWNFGDGITSEEFSPMHLYTVEGLYDISLHVYDENTGCQDSMMLEKAAIAERSGNVIFPNAFTPNPDGPNGGGYVAGDYNNDIFFPAHKGIEEYHLQIFNRWGELIFESKDITIGWDGYYRDRLCKQDVYVWKVKGKYIDGQQFIKAGDVTLLR